MKMNGLQSNDMARGCTCMNLSLCAASRYICRFIASVHGAHIPSSYKPTCKVHLIKVNVRLVYDR